jgi:hypothetical protein
MTYIFFTAGMHNMWPPERVSLAQGDVLSSAPEKLSFKINQV